MTIPFSQVCREYLAARGESPDLLPVLQDGEESAVLTLESWLRTMLVPLAVKATLEADLTRIDDIAEVRLTPEFHDGSALLTLPDDFLRFLTLYIDGAPVAAGVVMAAELPELPISSANQPETDARDYADVLSAGSALDFSRRSYVRQPPAAPDRKLYLLPDGRLLMPSLAADAVVTLRYVPAPFLDSSDRLHISTAAYHSLLTP